MDAGSRFQRLGPYHAKVRLRNLSSQTGTLRRSVFSDLMFALSGTYQLRRFMRYSGPWPRKHLYTSVIALNSILALIGNQCNSISSGLEWVCLGAARTSHTAALSTCCNFLVSFLGRPINNMLMWSSLEIMFAWTNALALSTISVLRMRHIWQILIKHAAQIFIICLSSRRWQSMTAPRYFTSDEIDMRLSPMQSELRILETLAGPIRMRSVFPSFNFRQFSVI